MALEHLALIIITNNWDKRPGRLRQLEYKQSTFIKSDVHHAETHSIKYIILQIRKGFLGASNLLLAGDLHAPAGNGYW